METVSEKLDFYGLSRKELAQILKDEFALPAFRADQLFQWVYQKQVSDVDQMSNIGKELRYKIGERFFFPPVPYDQRLISKDGSRKYLFQVEQGHKVESVMIKQTDRMTLCVSSQVGCALGCKFCRTGTMGLTRHLQTSEIMRQVLGVLHDAKNFGDSFSNMVFMGMGEPLHNFDNVVRAITILNDDFSLGLSARKITVSTVGLVPAIKKFGESEAQANLAVSLNATTDEVRSKIMPINDRYPLEVLLKTLREFPLRRRKRITIEYVMLHGLNDTDADLKRLPSLLKGIPAKINLIPYNDNAGLGFETPPESLVHRWQQELMQRQFVTTIRWSKGRDINAACGQLVTESIRQRRGLESVVSGDLAVTA